MNNQTVTQLAEKAMKEGDNATYRVAYRGNLLPGRSVETVSENLKSTFKMSDKQVSAFFSGRKFVVKKDLSRKRAVRLKAKLRDAGLEVAVSPSRQQSTGTTISAQPQPNISPDLPSKPKLTAPVRHRKAARAKPYPRVKAPSPQGLGSTRWVVMGAGMIFTAGAVWLFFTV